MVGMLGYLSGYGGLVVSIEGPSKCEIDCVTNKDNTSTVLYRPTEPGVYAVSVKFAGQHVRGELISSSWSYFGGL